MIVADFITHKVTLEDNVFFMLFGRWTYNHYTDRIQSYDINAHWHHIEFRPMITFYTL